MVFQDKLSIQKQIIKRAILTAFVVNLKIFNNKEGIMENEKEKRQTEIQRERGTKGVESEKD